MDGALRLLHLVAVRLGVLACWQAVKPLVPALRHAPASKSSPTYILPHRH